MAVGGLTVLILSKNLATLTYSQRGGCKLHNAQHTLTISSTRGSRVIGSSFFKI